MIHTMTQAGIALQVMGDIESSPTPYHAVATTTKLLSEAGFIELSIKDKFPAQGGRYFLATGGSLVAWITPDTAPTEYAIVAAHTDSPNLRVRTNPDVTSAGLSQVGVEVYGGVLLNSWLDRDLGLAGRVSVLRDGEPTETLVLDDQPILRIPQLAIHLDRDIRSKGLKLDPQTHLTPMWATDDESESSPGGLRDHVAELADCSPEDIVSWDLMAFDTAPPALVGREQEFVASARLDNQLSCFCAIRALIRAAEDITGGTKLPFVALYDHEEVGSSSATGAAGSFLANIIERVGASAGLDRVNHLNTLANSTVISADGAHATHPNYTERHEPSHQIKLNKGVVVKRNANQRYATDASSEGKFVAQCRQAGLPLQFYVHRNDLPCGSTIGPITAAQLAVPTIDIGAPQLAMHSIRELAGVADFGFLENAICSTLVSN